MAFPRLSVVIAFVLLMLVTALVSLQSLVSLLMWGLAAVVVQAVLFRGDQEIDGLGVFVFYAWAALLLYLAQLWTYPEYHGTSGGHGIGTDDSFFFSQVAQGLPWNFPIRSAYDLNIHNYSYLLRAVATPLHLLFTRTHLLDLLYFNTFVISLLPFFTVGVCRDLFHDSRATRIAFWTVLLCPFIMSNGAILMRDGLITTLFVGGIWSTLRRRWLLAIVMLAGATYLRTATGGMLAIILLVLGPMYFLTDGQTGRLLRPDGVFRVFFPLAFFFAGAAVVLPLVFGFQWWDEAFRGDFLNSQLRVQAVRDSGTSTFYVLSTLPWPVRVPLGLAFYLGSPFLSLLSLRAGDIWVPRAFLSNAFALVLPVYAAAFVWGLLRACRSLNIRALVLFTLILVNMALISQASMQLRHKLPLMPLFYILVAYGATSPYIRYRPLGWVVGGMLLAADIFITTLQLV